MSSAQRSRPSSRPKSSTTQVSEEICKSLRKDGSESCSNARRSLHEINVTSKLHSPNALHFRRGGFASEPLGILSVIAYSVAQRPRRLTTSAGALCQRQSLLEISIIQGISLTLPGVAIGSALAFVECR